MWEAREKVFFWHLFITVEACFCLETVMILGIMGIISSDQCMAEAWYLKHIRELEKKLRKALGEVNEKDRKLEELEKENGQLKDELKKMAMAKEAKRPRFPDYSVKKQEKKLQTKERQKSTGRIPLKEKLKLVEFEKDVYPKGVEPKDCVIVSHRIVTHLKDGRKEVWLYHIYRKKWGVERGKLDDVFGTSEYGIEIVVAIAFLVYGLGIPHTATCQILAFFCGIEMKKAEVNTLINQLSKSWQKEFEKIADLMVLSLFIHIDESGWKIGKENCYTWIFKSLTHTILLYGEKRDEAVLDRILPRDLFKGIGITDCYKMYEKRFTKAQKCWAHFLRKAIKLMLLYPEKKQYRDFFEELYRIFMEAKELKQKTGDKIEGVENLEAKIKKICMEIERKMSKDTEKDEREFVNLQKNLVRNLKDLFTFVQVEGVEPTNNHGEQGLRHVARSRNNYQTSKTKKGAKRHSIIASILFSLKQNLKEFTLKSVTQEAIRWRTEGQSLFDRQLQQTRALSP